jgi:hypothetical protein
LVGLLSCCTDWPQTKKGGPPPAQSAIFNPLLACALGEISGYCSKDQVKYATLWWSAVFPAFPRWIEELRNAGLRHDSQHGIRLINSAFYKKNKNNQQSNNLVIGNSTNLSNTNNLIFKYSKSIYGEVPHFKGKEQNAALELSPMVAIEVYACVACLYSS